MDKAAFIDLDKTLYDGYLFYDWIQSLKKSARGVVSLWEETALTETLVKHKLGAASYTHTAEEVAKMLNNESIEKVSLATEDFVKELDGFYDYADPLIQKLKSLGFKIVFVTNEPDFLAEMVKDKLGADDALGLQFEVKGEVFGDKVLNDLFSEHGKPNIVTEYAHEHQISLEDSVSYGDSEGDVEMLKLVGKGFLITEDKKLIEKVAETGIQVCNAENVLESL